MGVTLDEAVADGDARQAELDGYEAQFGKHVIEHGPFDMLRLNVGVQSFPIYWEDDPELSAELNAKQRLWFKRMICCALHHLVAEHSTSEEAQE